MKEHSDSYQPRSKRNPSRAPKQLPAPISFPPPRHAIPTQREQQERNANTTRQRDAEAEQSHPHQRDSIAKRENERELRRVLKNEY